jgi:hypothetical protein
MGRPQRFDSGAANGRNGQQRGQGGPSGWVEYSRGKPTLADIALMPYVARLDYLGLLGVWTENYPHIGVWWAQTQEWPSFRRGLRDRVSEDEFAEMRTHGPKTRDEVAALVAGLRHADPRQRPDRSIAGDHALVLKAS